MNTSLPKKQRSLKDLNNELLEKNEKITKKQKHLFLSKGLSYKNHWSKTKAGIIYKKIRMYNIADKEVGFKKIIPNLCYSGQNTVK